MDVGKRIIELRKFKNLSGNKLAQLAGISQAAINSIEKGKKFPTTYTLEKICSALDITLADFFKEKPQGEVTINDLIEEAKNLSPEQLKALKNTAKAMKK